MVRLDHLNLVIKPHHILFLFFIQVILLLLRLYSNGFAHHTGKVFNYHTLKAGAASKK